MTKIEAGSGGGSATAGGVNFQCRVGAWVCCYLLAEVSALPVGPHGVPRYIRFETAEPTDDILVGTREQRHSFVQAKRTIGFGAAELSSVIDQFVRQLVGSCGAQGSRPWNQSLDPERDRLVLVTTSESPSSLRVDLALVLDRVRTLAKGQPLLDATSSKDQKESLEKILTIVKATWKTATDTEATDDDAQDLLKLIHVVVLDVQVNGSGEREAINLLAGRVISRPQDAPAAWAKLIELALTASQQRTGLEEKSVRDALATAGISLRAAPRYESDVEKLRKYSKQTIQHLSRHSRMSSARIHVSRDVTAALVARLSSESVVVVGAPGAGKSGVMHDAAKNLIDSGKDVLLISADEIGAASLGQLRTELGLEHSIIEVLMNWPGGEPAFLIVDALDALRIDDAREAIVGLAERLIQDSPRWRIALSIRKYDLRYGVELRTLFAGQNARSPYTDLEFADLKHLSVPLFSDCELQDVRQRSAQLDNLLNSTPGALIELLRVPFNLRLMFEILESGIRAEEIRTIRTQTSLLRKYWIHRVVNGSGSSDRELLLQRACEAMVKERRLRTERANVMLPGLSSALDTLLSSQVFIEWQSTAASAPNRQILAFSHHIVFDYAVSEIQLPQGCSAICEHVATDPDIVLMVRPSLVMRFQQLWDDDRVEFWNLYFAMGSDTRIPHIAKVIGASVCTELARTVADFGPLIQKLRSSDKNDQMIAERAFKNIVGAYMAGSLNALSGTRAVPVCELIREVTQ